MERERADGRKSGTVRERASVKAIENDRARGTRKRLRGEYMGGVVMEGERESAGEGRREAGRGRRIKKRE